MAETVTSLLGPPPKAKGDPTVSDLLGPPPKAASDPFDAAPVASKQKFKPTVSPEQMELAKARADVGEQGFGDLAYQGVTFGYGRRIDTAIVRALHGDKAATAFEQAEREAQDKYRKKHPFYAAAAETGGMLLNPLSRMGGKWAASVGLGGKAQAAAGAAGGVYGYSQGGATGAAEDALLGVSGARYLGTAALSAAQSAINEFGEAAGTVKDRARSAMKAAVFGGGAGALLHGAGDIVGGVARQADAATGYRISDTARELAGRAKSVLGIGTPSTAPVLNGADRSAAERLRTPAARDRLETRNVKEQKRRSDTDEAPANLQEAGGQNVRRALRVAGRQPGDASNMTRDHAVAMAENLPVETVDRLKQISSYPGTAEQRVEELVREQSAAAHRDYREPWNAPVQLDEKAMTALDDPEMSHAMDVAARTARTRSHADPDAARQFKEINSLRRYYGEKDAYEHDLEQWKATGGLDVGALPKDAQQLLSQAETPAARDRLVKAFGLAPRPMPEAPKVPEISGGALDRIRIAARQRGDSLMNVPGGEKKDTHGLGSAIQTRVKAIDEHLDTVPHLKEARANYKTYQDRIEAAGSGMKVLQEKPENFKAYFDKLTSEGRDDLKIAVRDVLQKAAQGDTAAAIATLRKLGRGTYGQRNLETLLGHDGADKLIETANILRENLETSRQIAGVDNSRTINDAEDAQNLQHTFSALMHPTGAIRQMFETALSGNWKLNEHEAAAMVHFGHGDPQVLIDYLKANPQSAFARMVTAAVATEAAKQVTKQPVPDDRLPTGSGDDPFALRDPQGNVIGRKEPGQPLEVDVTGGSPQ